MSDIKVVLIKITSKCNYNCDFCRSEKDRKSDLSTKKIFSLLKELKNLGVTTILISGGEPTLRKDIINIIKKACDYGLQVKLSTNGELLNIDSMIELQNAGVNVLHFSVGDMSDEGRTNKVFKKIRAFEQYKKKMSISLSVITTSAFVKNISHYLSYIDQNGQMDIIEFIAPKFYNNKAWYLKNRLTTTSEINFFEYINQYNFDKRTVFSCGYKQLGQCPLVMENLYFFSITSDGEVYKCPYSETERYYIGDIKKESVRTLVRKYKNKSTDGNLLPCILEGEVVCSCN